MIDQANPQTLATHTGFTFLLRTVQPGDEPLLSDFFSRVTPEDLRFRFLRAVKHVSHQQLMAMENVDHAHSETFLALSPEGELLAVAMLAADDALERAEVALSIRPEFKNRGVSWSMLDRIVQFAEARGIGWLESIENRENVAAISLEREMGFVAEPIAGDPCEVVLRLRLPIERH